MFNKYCRSAPVTINGRIIEEVDSYVYLGKLITKDGNLIPEIKRRITLGWAAFGKVYNIMKSRRATMKFKRKIFNEYILSVMTYGSETWALTSTMKNMLRVTQRKMERIMLGITLLDKKTNNCIREEIGIRDIVTTIQESKHRWAGPVSRFKDNRWTMKVSE